MREILLSAYRQAEMLIQELDYTGGWDEQISYLRRIQGFVMNRL